VRARLVTHRVAVVVMSLNSSVVDSASVIYLPITRQCLIKIVADS
jgi:hypothetical protein